jgi:site-specific DNA-methyltransferase (adenine-specific)
MINFHNTDNMKFMADVPDKYYDLAIVDPPYGLGKRTTSGGGGKNKQSEKWENHDWDNEIPTNKYFDELFRVSKKQIIWGGNYFPYLWKKGCRGLITWDKMVYIPTMSQIEYAWYSEEKLPQLIKINNTDPERLHPTQKPIALYEWLLSKYAKPNDKIIDTHGGSGSIAIAVDKANTLDNTNYSLDIIELDKDYFDASLKRFNQYKSQPKIKFPIK